MVAFSPFLLLGLLLEIVVIGMVIGAVSGRSTAATVAQNWWELFRLRGICVDAILGATAFVVSL